MKPIIKKGLFIIGGILLLCFAILLYHVITVKPAEYENANIQVSRIDFENNIDAAQAKQICTDLRSIKGLTSDSIIVKRNVVVYFHNNKITNSEKVFNELIHKRDYKAKRFIVDASLANKSVCPMDQNSFSYKLFKTVNHFFN